MKVTSVTWGSDISLLADACNELGMELNAWSTHDLEDDSKRERCAQSFGDADVIILRPTTDAVWDEIIEELNKVDVPIISFGGDPSYWELSNVPLKVVATVNAYHIYGGPENIANMLRYIGKEVLGLDYEFDPPAETMWQGIYHPDAERPFESIDDYLEWYKPEKRHAIGILFHRTYWSNGDLEIIDAMIRELETEFDVIPAFCYGMGDAETGAKSSGEVLHEFSEDRCHREPPIDIPCRKRRRIGKCSQEARHSGISSVGDLSQYRRGVDEGLSGNEFERGCMECCDG
ncbi:MAG: hypothetical protein GWP10_05515 [Nitrospiraceae bacterium]|nr:hypothetical protein [Nitrospiraceae bacterium]